MNTGGTGLSANPRSRWVPQHHGDVPRMNPSGVCRQEPENEETPAPVCRKRQRKGVRGQRLKYWGQPARESILIENFRRERCG